MLSHPPSFKRSQSPSEGPRCGTSMGLQGSSVRGSGRSARRFCSTGPGRDVQGFGSCHAGLSAPCLPPSVPPPPAGPLPSPGSAQEMEAPRVRRKAASARGEPPGGSTHACAFGQQPWACSSTGTISPSSVPFQPCPGAGGKSCRLTLSKGV